MANLHRLTRCGLVAVAVSLCVGPALAQDSLFDIFDIFSRPASPQAPADSETESRPAFEIELPVDCLASGTCVIQSYVDVDPSRRWRDYQCRGRSFDGHVGTTFRLADVAAMNEGVNVLAVADGVVRGYRDGEPDGVGGEAADDGAKECGNGVIIDHGDGWESQYCHLRNGSVKLFRGRQVLVGEAIGRFGMSGGSDFPNVEFRLRYRNTAVDPFTGSPALDGCNQGGEPLWKPHTLVYLDYRPSLVLNKGFADTPPELDGVESGAYRAAALEASSPALHFYVRVIGVSAGDLEELELRGPDGAVLASKSSTIAKSTAQDHLSDVGLDAPDGGWSEGEYRGQYRLVRAGVTVLEAEVSQELPSRSASAAAPE